MKINITAKESNIGSFVSWDRLATSIFPASGELLPGETITHLVVLERGINFYVERPEPERKP